MAAGSPLHRCRDLPNAPPDQPNQLTDLGSIVSQLQFCKNVTRYDGAGVSTYCETTTAVTTGEKELAGLPAVGLLVDGSPGPSSNLGFCLRSLGQSIGAFHLALSADNRLDLQDVRMFSAFRFPGDTARQTPSNHRW
jgi:hypothetical protein